jgi:Immunoglobulin I-set domain.
VSVSVVVFLHWSFIRILFFFTDRPLVTLVAVGRTTYTLNNKEIFRTTVNDSVTLLCTADSYPASTIRWKKNNVDITSNVVKEEATIAGTYSFITTSSINITDIDEQENENEYSCEATASGLGSTSTTIRVLVRKCLHA